MKKFLFSIFALSIFAVNAFAQGQISIRDGFTEINSEKLDGIIGTTSKGRSKFSAKIKDIMSIIGIDYLYDIDNKFKIGTRLSLTTCKGGYYEDNVIGNIQTSLIPIMVGGSYNKNISKKFSLNGKLFCGVGLINFKSNCFDFSEVTHCFIVSQKATNCITEKRDKKVSEDSCCFIADFSVGPQYSFTKRFSIGLDLGYRFTPITTISENITIDFSGFTTGLSLNYRL